MKEAKCVLYTYKNVCWLSAYNLFNVDEGRAFGILLALCGGAWQILY